MVWHPYILLPIYPFSCSKLLALNTPTVFDVHQFHVVLHVTCMFVTLNNVQYTNNSVVTITDIGTGSAALLCTTTYRPCCFSYPPTHWYFPNGSRVDLFDTLPYYRRRTDASSSPPGSVILHRNPGATTTGIFWCDMQDATGTFQSLYVGIYAATTGESCTVEEQQVCIARAYM